MLFSHKNHTTSALISQISQVTKVNHELPNLRTHKAKLSYIHPIRYLRIIIGHDIVVSQQPMGATMKNRKYYRTTGPRASAQLIEDAIQKNIYLACRQDKTTTELYSFLVGCQVTSSRGYI